MEVTSRVTKNIFPLENEFKQATQKFKPAGYKKYKRADNLTTFNKKKCKSYLEDLEPAVLLSSLGR